MSTRFRFLVVFCLLLCAAPARASWCQWLLDGVTRGGYSARSTKLAAAGFRYALDPANPHAARIAALHDLADTWSYYSLEYIAKHQLPDAMIALFDVEEDRPMAKAFAALVFKLTARVAMFLDERFPVTSRQEAAVTETFDKLVGFSLLAQQLLDPPSQAWNERRIATEVGAIPGASLEDEVKRGAFVLGAIEEARDAFVLGRIADGVLRAMKKESEERQSPVTLALLRTCLRQVQARAQRWVSNGGHHVVGTFFGLPLVVLGATDPDDEEGATRRSNARLSQLILERVARYVAAPIEDSAMRQEMEHRFVISGWVAGDLALVRQRRFVRSGFRSLQERVYWEWLLAEPLPPLSTEFQLEH